MHMENSTLTHRIILVLMETKELDAKRMFSLGIFWVPFPLILSVCDDPLLCSTRFFIKASGLID